MSIGLRFRNPGGVGIRRMLWIHDTSKLETPAVSPQALGITNLLKPFLFPWGLFQVQPGGGVGMRTQPSKLIPRVLATSTAAHPTPEQARLKSKSICEVQHSLFSPSLAFINTLPFGRLSTSVSIHRSTDISFDSGDSFSLPKLKHSFCQMGSGRGGRRLGFRNSGSG